MSTKERTSHYITPFFLGSLAAKPSQQQFPVHSGSNKLAMNVPLTNSSTTVVPRQRPRGSAKTAGNSIVASTVVVSGKPTVPLPPLPSPSQPKAGKNLYDSKVLN